MAKSKFQQAVENTPEVSNVYKPGSQALKKGETGKIIVADSKKLDGSVDIDSALKDVYKDANRWDYAIGYDSKVCFVEIHPAFTSEVSTMIAKLTWLKSWLKDKAPKINNLPKIVPTYTWIQSGKCSIIPGSREEKKLATYGLKPMKILRLK